MDICLELSGAGQVNVCVSLSGKVSDVFHAAGNACGVDPDLIQLRCGDSVVCDGDVPLCDTTTLTVDDVWVVEPNAMAEARQILRERGESDFNASLSQRVTTFNTATDTPSLGHIKLLLVAGADATATDSSHCLLVHAVFTGCLELVKILAEKCHECTPQLRDAFNAAATAWCRPIVEYLAAQFPASVLTPSQTGLSPVHFVCHSGGIDALRFLLDAAPHLAREGLAPLYYATSSGKLEFVKELISRGADPGATTSGGRTALHAAALQGNAAIAEALLEAGAPVDPLDSSGNTPLFAAVEGCYVDTSSVLLKHGANPNVVEPGYTPLHIAAHTRPEILAELIAAGAQCDMQDAAGNTSLHLAAGNGTVDDVRALLDAGCSPNSPNHILETPLVIATMFSEVEMVELLVRCGGDPRCASETGWNPFHIAAGTSDCILECFLRQGKPEVPPLRDGRTMLHIAAAAGKERCVALLLEAGFSPEVRCENGCSPVDVAHPRCKALLQKVLA